MPKVAGAAPQRISAAVTNPVLLNSFTKPLRALTLVSGVFQSLFIETRVERYGAHFLSSLLLVSSLLFSFDKVTTCRENVHNLAAIFL